MAVVEGHHALRAASLVGAEAPVHARSSGKVWRAGPAGEALRRYSAGRDEGTARPASCGHEVSEAFPV